VQRNQSPSLASHSICANPHAIARSRQSRAFVVHRATHKGGKIVEHAGIVRIDIQRALCPFEARLFSPNRYSICAPRYRARASSGAPQAAARSTTAAPARDFGFSLRPDWPYRGHERRGLVVIRPHSRSLLVQATASSSLPGKMPSVREKVCLEQIRLRRIAFSNSRTASS